jgi:hypothetical protein
MEGQELVWVTPSELAQYPTPPADAALVRLLAATASTSDGDAVSLVTGQPRG